MSMPLCTRLYSKETCGEAPCSHRSYSGSTPMGFDANLISLERLGDELFRFMLLRVPAGGTDEYTVCIHWHCSSSGTRGQICSQGRVICFLASASSLRSTKHRLLLTKWVDSRLGLTQALWLTSLSSPQLYTRKPYWMSPSMAKASTTCFPRRICNSSLSSLHQKLPSGCGHSSITSWSASSTVTMPYLPQEECQAMLLKYIATPFSQLGLSSTWWISSLADHSLRNWRSCVRLAFLWIAWLLSTWILLIVDYDSNETAKELHIEADVYYVPIETSKDWLLILLRQDPLPPDDSDCF